MLLPEKKEEVRELGLGWWATKQISGVRTLEAEAVPRAGQAPVEDKDTHTSFPPSGPGAKPW